MKQMAFDEILVQNILDGSEGPFVVLYDRYRKQVYVVAYRILRHPEDAQDAMQEIFVKIHRSLHKWNAGKSRLATWIYRLAINHSIDCCRMRR
jgi:RNA polymerase sigma factor (sigma-70 family)